MANSNPRLFSWWIIPVMVATILVSALDYPGVPAGSSGGMQLDLDLVRLVLPGAAVVIGVLLLPLLQAWTVFFNWATPHPRASTLVPVDAGFVLTSRAFRSLQGPEIGRRE